MAALLFVAKLAPFVFGADCSPNQLFFFLPSWYEYLNLTPDPNGGCSVIITKFPDDLLPIGLAVLDILLRLAGLVAIIAMIAAGVGYITAQGNPEKTASARRRIYNAFIGLAIVFIASGLVAFIGNKVGG